MTVDAELQIHELWRTDATETTAVVRYSRPDHTIDPAHSGLVTLQGTGVRELSPTIAETGRRPVMPVVQGDNPPPP